MKKYITDERIGLKYEFVGDYNLLAGEDEPEVEIGLWGADLRWRSLSRRLRSTDRGGSRDISHAEFLKKHKRSVYNEFLYSGKLTEYLADIDR